MASKNLGRLALAALGIIAYQNRDKLGKMLHGTDGRTGDQEGGGGVTGMLGGLSEIVDRFRNAGSGSAADSWIGNGPNERIEPEHVERAIDPETLDALAAQTGLSRQEILSRLAVNIPETIHEMTPQGRLPQDTDDMSGQPSLLDPVPPRRI